MVGEVQQPFLPFFMPEDEVYFEASFDPNKQCVKIDGDGAAQVIFVTDATQLAGVVSAIAAFKEGMIGVTLKRLPKDLHGGQDGVAETHR